MNSSGTKFSQISYERPDLVELKGKMETLLARFNHSGAVEEQIDIINQIYVLRSRFETMSNVASIRNTIDTSDSFYEQEQNYFDNHQPLYLNLVTEFYKSLLNSKFRTLLEEKYGKQLFQIANLTTKIFSTSIIEELQRENELSTEYTKLIASASIDFDGKELNLSGMVPYKVSTFRHIRKAAHHKTEEFFIEHASQLDNIFDQLVKVRHTIALKLGYKNFLTVGYMRMYRTDYDAGMVEHFRNLIEKKIVPIASDLKERQRKRLNLDKLLHYDEPLDFTTGNAKPKGSPDWIIGNAEKMYSELSDETGEFFRFMMDNELMDLVNKPNKAGGGYCTFLSEMRAPFIFSNFNGTSQDIDVLTHEAGHAFQTFCSRHLALEEYFFPTSEAAEIHSMSMEFITWPWMNLFFDGQTDKYKFAHLSHSLLFLPYGVSVDEFQHFVYENPEATPLERNAAWRAIEKKYLPHRDYDGSRYLEGGGFWHRQAHIYKHPFYYIDYTLAQICAYQFWKKSEEDKEAAMSDYIRLCREGGSKSFLELVKVANLKSPFEEATLNEVVSDVKNWLEQVDDERLN
ncbi:MAG: M3 family oligoendopeptidase [Chitinophagales bacterium]|nr:M3 family oligoendopeptidase [Chitinophagales bacterium]